MHHFEKKHDVISRDLKFAVVGHILMAYVFCPLLRALQHVEKFRFVFRQMVPKDYFDDDDRDSEAEVPRSPSFRRSHQDEFMRTILRVMLEAEGASATEVDDALSGYELKAPKRRMRQVHC